MTVRQTLSLVMGLLLVAGQMPAQDAAAPPPMTIEDLRMIVSRSLVIDYPADISRISTSNPDVVDAVPATTREFLLHGKGIGNATVVVWAKNGQRTMYNIVVDHNMDPIRKILKETFPNEPIQTQAGRDAVTLTGTVSSKEVADRAVAMVTPLARAVVSDLRVVTPVSKQLIIKVRFAELSRSWSHQFGAAFISTDPRNPAQITTQQFAGSPPPAFGAGAAPRFSLTDALNLFAFRPDLDLAAVVKLLQAQGVLQILAEPNLITSNGREASFLVGGEFPVPVLQGGSNAGAVTVQFREFGIRLNFTPNITEHGTIKLYCKPEVSTIDIGNAVTVSGFVIPALATKRIETNIELGIGQSFVIGGLIDDRVQETFNKIPGLANIPVLGTFFKSRGEQRNKSELIVMVTPEIVNPLDVNDPKPMPVWVKPFLEKLKPGDKWEGVVKSSTIPTPEQAMHKEPMPGEKPKNENKDDGGPLAKLKFWGRDGKDGAGQGHGAVKGAATNVAGVTVVPVASQPLAPADLTVGQPATPGGAVPAAPVAPDPAPAAAAPASAPAVAPSADPAAAGTVAGPGAAPADPVPANAAPTAPAQPDPAPASVPAAGKAPADPPRAEAAPRRPMTAGLTSVPVHLLGERTAEAKAAETPAAQTRAQND